MTNKNTENYIVGIDLGTTNSGVAIWDKNEQRPEIITNIMNEQVTPSVVAIQDGEIVVGNIAKNILREMIEGDEATTTHKRDMGTPTSISFNGRKVPPYILGSYVLKALKKQAEDYLGAEIDRAVITVPAYFAQSAIEDTKRAGEGAGFEVEALLPEPTAAALAFGQKVEENTRLMVYDLGGGTFDISVIEAVEGQFIVRANDGNRYLGGDDFDSLLRNYILEQSGYGHLLKSNHPRDKIALQQLNLMAEDAKIRLSTLNSIQVRSHQYYDSNNELLKIDLLITRAVFEELIRPKIDESIEYCHRALKNAEVDIKNIKDILLVGGSTRIPYVTARIEQEFGIKPNKRINPMTCVTEGAAIHTRSLKCILPGTKLSLEMPRKPKSPTSSKTVEIMGVLRPQTGYEDQFDLNGAVAKLVNGETVQNQAMINKIGGFFLSAELQENIENLLQLIITDAQGRQLETFQFAVVHNYEAKEEPQVTRIENVIPYPFSVGLVGKVKNAVLIKEQSALPVEATEIFALAQDGQTELVIPIYEGKDPDPDRNRMLGEISISNLPPHLKREDQVRVTFQMDESRILHIDVQVPRADLLHQKDIEIGKVLVTEQVDELAQAKLLRQYGATLNNLEDDLDQKLPLIPEEQRVQIGNREGRLRQEAAEALQNKEIGKLGAKIEELAGLNQEISNKLPDLGLINEFRESAEQARSLVCQPGVKAVDESSVEEVIAAGEKAIGCGDNNTLRNKHKELQRLLERIYDDLRKHITPEQILVIIMRRFETCKQEVALLLAGAGRSGKASDDANAQKGIIRRDELGMATAQRSSAELQRKIDVSIDQGERHMYQSEEALRARNEYLVKQLYSEFGLLVNTLEGLITDLRRIRS